MQTCPKSGEGGGGGGGSAPPPSYTSGIVGIIMHPFNMYANPNQQRWEEGVGGREKERREGDVPQVRTLTYIEFVIEIGTVGYV